MYLDGNRYGITKTEDGWVVTTEFNYDGKSTSDKTLEYVYEDGEYYTCEHCGRRVNRDDAYWCGDYAYCNSDCAAAYGWDWCDRCGECIWKNDCIRTEDGNVYCCESCAKRDDYYKCPECGRFVYTDNLYSSEDGSISMCLDCIESSKTYKLDEKDYIVEIKEEEDNDD